MLSVKVYDKKIVEEKDIKFVVIVSFYNNKLVVVRHRQRKTWEIPGGHRETYESADEAARRELFEETGALKFKLKLLNIYSVYENEIITYGNLYCAQIEKFTKLPESEIAETSIVEELPKNLTYPQIQPFLYKTAIECMLKNPLLRN